jgi:hypothetical protein
LRIDINPAESQRTLLQIVVLNVICIGQASSLVLGRLPEKDEADDLPQLSELASSGRHSTSSVYCCKYGCIRQALIRDNAASFYLQPWCLMVVQRRGEFEEQESHRLL